MPTLDPRANPNDAAPLRIGVLTRSEAQLQRWQFESLRRLLQRPGVQLALVVVDPRTASDHPPTLADTGGVLWRNYYRHYLLPRSTALQPVPSGEIFADVARIAPILRRRSKWTEEFANHDVEAIRRERLDLLVRYGFGILRGEILSAAKWGIWSYHLGDPWAYRGGPPCFWEVVHGARHTHCILQRLTPKLDSGIILGRTSVPTNTLSYLRHLDSVASAAAPLLSKAADLLRRNPNAIEGLPQCASTAPIRHAPGDVEFLRFCSLITARRFSSYVVRRTT